MHGANSHPVGWVATRSASHNQRRRRLTAFFERSEPYSHTVEPGAMSVQVGGQGGRARWTGKVDGQGGRARWVGKVDGQYGWA
eukprot:6471923-Prymnesium_polylepis.1